MKNKILILFMLLPTYFTYAQKQTNLGIGATLEKISENDIFLPGAEINLESIFNNKFSMSASMQYGQKNTLRNDLKSLNTKVTALYTLFNSNNHKLKIGGGIGFRNVSNIFASTWTESQGNIKDVKYSEHHYNTLGFHFQLEYDWLLSNRLVLTPNLGYQRLLQNFQSYSLGIRLGYCFKRDQ